MYIQGFPGGSVVKSTCQCRRPRFHLWVGKIPWRTQIPSLGREDPLEEGTATHSSILAWEISGMEEPTRLWSMGSQRAGYHWAAEHACTYCLFAHVRTHTELSHWTLRVTLWGKQHKDDNVTSEYRVELKSVYSLPPPSPTTPAF